MTAPRPGCASEGGGLNATPPAGLQTARPSARLPRRPRAPRQSRPVLIVDWRRAWRMLSVQAAAIAVTFGLLPPDQQAAILAALGVPAERLPLVLGLLFLAARLLHQGALHLAEPAPAPPSPPSSEIHGYQPRSSAISEICAPPVNPNAPADRPRQDTPRQRPCT